MERHCCLTTVLLNSKVFLKISSFYSFGCNFLINFHMMVLPEIHYLFKCVIMDLAGHGTGWIHVDAYASDLAGGFRTRRPNHLGSLVNQLGKHLIFQTWHIIKSIFQFSFLSFLSLLLFAGQDSHLSPLHPLSASLLP